MKAILTFLLALTLASGLALVAQENHQGEKKSSDQITISTPVKVGNQVLEPGRYEIACDRTTITFRKVDSNKVVASVPCAGKIMDQPAERTELHTDIDKNGVRFVQKLLIHGSIVEHTF